MKYDGPISNPALVDLVIDQDLLGFMTTQSSSHSQDLKIEVEIHGYWLSRCGKANGAKYAVCVEQLVDGKWLTVLEYGEPD
jgi:hypothetical protein